MDFSSGATSLSRLELLPLELLYKILREFNDIPSLCSAALTCRALHYAVKGFEHVVTTAVLSHQLYPVTINDAVRRQRSTSVNRRDLGSIENWITEFYNGGNVAIPKPLTLNLASRMAQFHCLVEQLTEDVIGHVDRFFPDGLQAPSNRMVSTSEVLRIQRALYQYDIFCNLFYDDPSTFRMVDLFFYNMKSQQIEDYFLSHFSPWENEQLACVLNFISRELRPIFNEFAAHDVRWGALGVQLMEIDDHSEQFQHMLSIGLERIAKIIRCKDYDSCREILSMCPQNRTRFLSHAFRRINGLPNGTLPQCTLLPAGESKMLSEFTPADERLYVKPAFFDDADPGPAMIWRSVHQDSYPLYFFNLWGFRHIEWGYVFWDNDRLKGMQTWCDSVEHPVAAFTQIRRTVPSLEPELLRGLSTSYHSRRQIYFRGGRGWWSADDQSRLVWLMRKRKADPLDVDGGAGRRPSKRKCT